jgi:hypothetical protein
MIEKIARELQPGDCIEMPTGMFKVEKVVWGLAGTVVVQGSVRGVMSEWTTYAAEQPFITVTVH